MNDQKIINYIFTALSSIFIIIALITFYNTLIFVKKSVVTQGKIVGIVKEDSAGEDGISYQPIVEFETKDKKKIRFVSEIRSSFSFDQVDDSVEVIYNPASPHEAKINKFSRIWFMTIIFGSMGVIFLLCIIYANKAQKTQSFE